jgi:glycerol-3-phosphate acyltransferase PlsX
MGTIYAEKVRGVSSPKVGLLANGEEAGKGNDLVKHTYPLLADSGLNFFGNIEGKELIGGKVDVAVTDGFTGNILLKSSEAVAKMLMDKIKEAIVGGGLLAKIGGVLIKPSLRGIKKLMDPSEHGAAPLLGVNGLVFIGHGRSDALAIQNAVRVARDAINADVLTSIRSAIENSLNKKD